MEKVVNKKIAGQKKPAVKKAVVKAERPAEIEIDIPIENIKIDAPEVKDEPVKAALVPVYIKSYGTSGPTKIDVDGVKKRFVQGGVNGKKFEVPCDQQAMVSPEVAGALAGLIARQKGNV